MRDYILIRLSRGYDYYLYLLLNALQESFSTKILSFNFVFALWRPLNIIVLQVDVFQGMYIIRDSRQCPRRLIGTRPYVDHAVPVPLGGDVLKVL